MKALNISTALLLGLLSLSGYAQEAEPVSGKMAIQGVTKQMTVTRVDQETREISLSYDGMESTYIAGPEIRNFAQIQAGDILTVTLGEAIAVRVFPVSEGPKGSLVQTELSRAPLGGKPYGMISRRVTLNGRIEALDKTARTAVIEGKNSSVSLSVADDVDLSNIQVKDWVRVDYMERLSLSIDSPAD